MVDFWLGMFIAFNVIGLCASVTLTVVLLRN